MVYTLLFTKVSSDACPSIVLCCDFLICFSSPNAQCSWVLLSLCSMLFLYPFLYCARRCLLTCLALVRFHSILRRVIHFFSFLLITTLSSDFSPTIVLLCALLFFFLCCYAVFVGLAFVMLFLSCCTPFFYIFFAVHNVVLWHAPPLTAISPFVGRFRELFLLRDIPYYPALPVSRPFFHPLILLSCVSFYF